MAVALGFSNQTDEATLGGGSWNASYPLTNLQNRYLAQKARTTNDATGSTYITIDLGSDQLIGVMALISTNISPSATIRVRGADNSGMSSPDYDSGAISSYQHTDYAISFTQTDARYWRIDINDTSNPDGYVEIGRLFIGSRFRPGINCEIGAALGVESRTQTQEALNGPEYFDERVNRRTWRGAWTALTDAEAYRQMLVIQQNTDINGEIYFFEDDDDIEFQDLRWFYARFRTLNALEWPYVNRHSIAIEVSELL
jgi:hypothetical protein